MSQEDLKAKVGQAALDWLPHGAIVGVGTGSTVDKFIDALGQAYKADRTRVLGAVSSSLRSTQRLQAFGIPVLALESVTGLEVYVDGADEINPLGYMVKGGGAALTREKIVAELAKTFVCIVDESKWVEVLGKFPLPVEVIPLAAPQVMRAFAAMGGLACVREGVVTENGQCIVDVTGLNIHDPMAFEAQVNQWPGVVTVGVFARNRANVCLLGTLDGVKVFKF